MTSHHRQGSQGKGNHPSRDSEDIGFGPNNHSHYERIMILRKLMAELGTPFQGMENELARFGNFGFNGGKISSSSIKEKAGDIRQDEFFQEMLRDWLAREDDRVYLEKFLSHGYWRDKSMTALGFVKPLHARTNRKNGAGLQFKERFPQSFDKLRSKVKRNARAVCTIYRAERDTRIPVIDHLCDKKYRISKTNPRELKLDRLNRFIDDPVLGIGTGFLVADSWILTAGHNLLDFETGKILSKAELQKLRFNFAFEKERYNRSTGEIKGFRELEFLYEEHKGLRVNGREDWVLIKIKKSTSTRRTPVDYKVTPIPVNVPEMRQYARYEPLYMIGHPLGLPKMVTPNAEVWGNEDSNFFYSTLDAFRGNSGSPVFSAKTHQLVGILVAGERDFETLPGDTGTSQTLLPKTYTKVEFENGLIEGEKCQKITPAIWEEVNSHTN